MTVPPLSASTPELCSQDEEAHVSVWPQGRQPIGFSSSVELNASISPVNNGAAASPGSVAHSPVHADTPHEFRVMLNKVADKLDEDNVFSLAFIHELPKDKQRQPLSCFEHLQKIGIFSWKDTDPLKKLLQDINRYDLVTTLVEEYETLRQQNMQHRPVVRSQTHSPVLVHQSSDPIILGEPVQPQQRLNSLPTSTLPFSVDLLKPLHAPQQETTGGDSLTSAEKTLPQSIESDDEEQSKQASSLGEWDLVEIPNEKPRAQSSGNITAPELPVKEQLTQSMPSRRTFCQLLRTTKLPGTSTSWTLQVKELLPSMSSSAKCHLKLSKKSIDIKCNELPKHKFTCIFTVHPPTSVMKSADFLSLEVTVISKFATPSNAHLDLAITIKSRSGSELVKHHLEKKPLQSFYLPKFLLTEKLQQLDPTTRIVMEIQTKIGVTMEYVVVNM